MSLTVQFPSEYGYVLAAASGSFIVNYLHFILTARFRKASGLLYPIPYATEEQAKKDPNAFKFNCGTWHTRHRVQRHPEPLLHQLLSVVSFANFPLRH
jgi:glutathione S-transferase